MKQFAVLATAATLAAVPVLAHHGWSEYDQSRPLKLVGTIEESGYEHPHGYIRLKTDDKNWTVVLAPPTRMQNRGLGKEKLAPGNRAAVYGYPNRNKPEELRAERITIDEKTTELR